MRKLVGVLAAVSFAALLVAPATAAGTKSGCKGAWTDTGSCTFTYKGGGFAVQAKGSGGVPTTLISVRLEAAGPAPGSQVVVLSCGLVVGDPGAPAQCAGASEASASPFEPKVGSELTCSVVGRGSGKYRCSSGG